MKYTIIVVAVLACLNVNAQKKQTVKPGPSLKLTTPNDSLQYTLGAYIGQLITNNGFVVSNPDLFARGVNDVLQRKPLSIPATEVATRLDSYQKRLISQKSSRQEQILFLNIRNQKGVGTLPSGVNYVVMKPGSGLRPQATDTVLIHVRGFLPDGKTFEDTYAKKTPFRGVPGAFVPGLNEVLQSMPVGSTWRVFVPSALAYAERGIAGLIPPYSAVIYEVELINAVRAK